jgi:FkbM family methyltransferase
MLNKISTLASLLEIKAPIDIVDIGANLIGGEDEAPYKPLLDSGLAHLYGFEPNPDALARLNAAKGQNETYFPSAVYNGAQQELRVCQQEGMTSLLEPNINLLCYLHGFSEWGKVVERISVPTVRLDDFSEIKNLDYLKIDIQGGELEVFRNGTNRLKECLVIQTEVEFLPMYEGQPLFSEVELYLRGLGFTFHKFFPLTSRIVQPMLINNNIYSELSQATYADAIFVKDFTKFDQLDPEQLKKISLILNDIYGSLDIALRALMACDVKNKSNYAAEYLKYLSK